MKKKKPCKPIQNHKNPSKGEVLRMENRKERGCLVWEEDENE